MQMQVALSSIFLGLAAAAEEGYSGTIKSLDGGLEGTFTVTNDSAITVTDYKLEDASAPALYWWGSTDEDLSKGFRISNERVDDASSSDSIVISLDAGYKPSDFSYAGLWCESFKTNFGQAKLVEGGSDEDGEAMDKADKGGGTGAAAGFNTRYAAVGAITVTSILCALSLA